MTYYRSSPNKGKKTLHSVLHTDLFATFIQQSFTFASLTLVATINVAVLLVQDDSQSLLGLAADSSFLRKVLSRTGPASLVSNPRWEEKYLLKVAGADWSVSWISAPENKEVYHGIDQFLRFYHFLAQRGRQFATLIYLLLRSIVC